VPAGGRIACFTAQPRELLLAESERPWARAGARSGVGTESGLATRNRAELADDGVRGPAQPAPTPRGPARGERRISGAYGRAREVRRRRAAQLRGSWVGAPAVSGPKRDRHEPSATPAWRCAMHAAREQLAPVGDRLATALDRFEAVQRAGPWRPSWSDLRPVRRCRRAAPSRRRERIRPSSAGAARYAARWHPAVRRQQEANTAGLRVRALGLAAEPERAARPEERDGLQARLVASRAGASSSDRSTPARTSTPRPRPRRGAERQRETSTGAARAAQPDRRDDREIASVRGDFEATARTREVVERLFPTDRSSAPRREDGEAAPKRVLGGAVLDDGQDEARSRLRRGGEAFRGRQRGCG